MQSTAELLQSTDFPAISRRELETVQVNLGYKCNLSCTHCHVNAGPSRTEMMSAETVDMVLQYLARSQAKVLDLTGGAPELSDEFQRIVSFASELNVEVIDRCNLTILEEPGQEHLGEFLAQHGVTVVASLPCYSEKNVREQRGSGVFEASIKGLQRLNALGYGTDPKLQLHLVYNPNGAFLPPDQMQLEQQYKDILGRNFGIRFNQLFALANMPIQRFGAVLLAKNKFHSYMDLLRSNYQAENLDSLMCLSTVSIDWQGYLYDCDFNQMLNMPMAANLHKDRIGSDRRPHIRDLLQAGDLNGSPIAVAEHCYGCTAGQGSGCTGALG